MDAEQPQDPAGAWRQAIRETTTRHAPQSRRRARRPRSPAASSACRP
jgi:hypothetical protein